MCSLETDEAIILSGEGADMAEMIEEIEEVEAEDGAHKQRGGR